MVKRAQINVETSAVKVVDHTVADELTHVAHQTQLKKSGGGKTGIGPVMLLVIDGWGYDPNPYGNPVAHANTPNYDKLWAENPHLLLQASGLYVGLPGDKTGTSEVGHQALGAGRWIEQPLLKVDNSIVKGSFQKNPMFLNAIKNAKKNGGALHIMGLTSDGGVHSDIKHLYALLEMVKDSDIEKVFLHTITDGRDRPKKSAVRNAEYSNPGFIEQVEAKIKELGLKDKVKIATVGGRNYYMDRYEQNWGYTEIAYRAMREGVSEVTAKTAVEAVQNAYGREEDDECMYPTVIVRGDGKPVGKVNDGDSLIFFNTRQDRAIQISQAFVLDDFQKFQRGRKPDLNFVQMVQYDPSIQSPVAFKTEEIPEGLLEVLDGRGVKTFSIAEGYKDEHAGFYFRSGLRQPYPTEDHVTIPSPNLDANEVWKQPELSSEAVTQKAVEMIESGEYGFGIINIACCDMVGHCGRMEAGIRAVEATDNALGQIATAVKKQNGILFVTADHGDIERIINVETNEPHNEHTTNPVPFMVITDKDRMEVGLVDSTKLDHSRSVKDVHSSILKDVDINKPALQDVAPTILKAMKLPIPDKMTGSTLVREIKLKQRNKN
jgi:2,3-bisphosphoglycerate-independent phosphoglycerate mutase